MGGKGGKCLLTRPNAPMAGLRNTSLEILYKFYQFQLPGLPIFQFLLDHRRKYTPNFRRRRMQSRIKLDQNAKRRAAEIDRTCGPELQEKRARCILQRKIGRQPVFGYAALSFFSIQVVNFRPNIGEFPDII